MELKKLNQLIANISKGSKARRESIQQALIGCAMYAYERNTDPALRLFKAVGGETDQKAMSNWLSLNAPVHFVEGVPKLSSDRQKEIAGAMTPAEFEATLKAAAPWFEMNREANKATNVWDTAAQVEKLDAYMLAAIVKMRKHDSAVAEVLDRAHNLFRAELSKVFEVEPVTLTKAA